MIEFILSCILLILLTISGLLLLSFSIVGNCAQSKKTNMVLRIIFAVIGLFFLVMAAQSIYFTARDFINHKKELTRPAPAKIEPAKTEPVKPKIDKEFDAIDFTYFTEDDDRMMLQVWFDDDNKIDYINHLPANDYDCTNPEEAKFCEEIKKEFDYLLHGFELAQPEAKTIYSKADLIAKMEFVPNETLDCTISETKVLTELDIWCTKINEEDFSEIVASCFCETPGGKYESTLLMYHTEDYNEIVIKIDKNDVVEHVFVNGHKSQCQEDENNKICGKAKEGAQYWMGKLDCLERTKKTLAEISERSKRALIPRPRYDSPTFNKKKAIVDRHFFIEDDDVYYDIDYFTADSRFIGSVGYNIMTGETYLNFFNSKREEVEIHLDTEGEVKYFDYALGHRHECPGKNESDEDACLMAKTTVKFFRNIADWDIVDD